MRHALWWHIASALGYEAFLLGTGTAQHVLVHPVAIRAHWLRCQSRQLLRSITCVKGAALTLAFA